MDATTARAALRAALREAASVVWPVACAGCGARDVAVCAACRAALDGPLVRERLGGVPLLAAADYDGAVRALVRATKEHGGRAERAALAAGLARALAASPAAAAVRVPPSREGLRRRGFDPLRLVLAAAGVDAPALRRVGAAGAQKARTAGERRLAARGSLVVPAALARRLRGREAVVVDDVVTTGATALEAVRALRAAGARPVAIVAVARAQRAARVPLASAQGEDVA